MHLVKVCWVWKTKHHNIGFPTFKLPATSQNPVEYISFLYMITRLSNRVQLSIYSTRAILLCGYEVQMNMYFLYILSELLLVLMQTEPACWYLLSLLYCMLLMQAMLFQIVRRESSGRSKKPAGNEVSFHSLTRAVCKLLRHCL